MPAPTTVESTFGLEPGTFPFESRFADIAGARVHYVDEGTGPVLLLLHGNPVSSFVFRHVICGLRDRFRCIALDYPGFGLSTAPAGYGFRPEEHARVVAAFVDHLALESFTPVVNDWGGPIGLWVASQRPERVRGAIVGNTWCWPIAGDFHFEAFSRVMGGPAGRFAIRRFNAFVNVLVPAGIKPSRVSPEAMRVYRAAFPTPERRMPTYVFPRAIEHSSAFLAECERGLAALANVPALILWGDADFAFRARERERFERGFAEHRTHVLNGAGHFIWEDAPDEIVATIRAWRP